MERLTIEYCGEYVPKELCSIDRLGGADDCDLCCEYCKATEEGNEDCRGCAINQCFNKLGEYEDLEEQGKLQNLPCAVGDSVYTNTSMQGWYFRKKDRPYKAKVVFIGINGTGNYINVDFGNGRMLSFGFSDIGENVFLDREEAKTALEERENGKLWTTS